MTILLIGLPGERPGGIALTVVYAVGAALTAVGVGFGYAVLAARPTGSAVVVQAFGAALRGVPLLLLIFALANMSRLPVRWAGAVGLALYSAAHVGEILRGFVGCYPALAVDQAWVMGGTRWQEWCCVRGPWLWWRALPALSTHWVSLLKDTGALVVLGIPELTTVAKMCSERTNDGAQWVIVLACAAALYLTATLVLVHGLHGISAWAGASRAIGRQQEGRA